MNLRKFLVAGFTAVMMAGFGALVSSAASVPNIQVRSNGAENEYEVTLQNVSSETYGVQFDLTVDSDKDITVNWADGDSGNVQKAVQTDSNGKTQITFYVSKLRPLSNSSNVQVATIVTDRELNSSSFATSGYMKTVNQNQKSTVYQDVMLDTKLTPDGSNNGSGSDNSSGNNSGSNSGNNKPSDTNQSQNTSRPSGSQQITVSQTNTTGKQETDKNQTTEGTQKTLAITIEQGQQLDADILRNAIEQKISVTLQYGNYQWTFDGANGGSVPDKQKFYDFSLEMLSQHNLTAAAEGSDLLQFAVQYQGQMPCPASLTITVGADYAGQTLYLAYYDELAATLQKTAEAVVNQDGTVVFPIENAAKYIVTSKDLWTAAAKTEEMSVQTSEQSQSTALDLSGNVVVTVPPMMTEEELEAQEAAQETTENEEISTTDESETLEQNAQSDSEKQSQEDSKAVVVIASIAVVILFGAVIAFLFVRVANKRRA
ncbi:hypothetical protein [Negativibacillus massiliensis]|uniref:hypothetical protein n=1 Tax=Negativibacillus massiliensis TaxID=1871035 RepID=UPI003AF2E328